MPSKKSYITCTDQFCGAGGSSQGAVAAGVEVVWAMNHWKRAIETHSTNFPNTKHDCSDISASDPRRYNSTDILITSPECTNHSLAKGKKVAKTHLELYAKGILDPAAERSRATMWDVPRFAEYHRYNIIIVENVVDARKWVMFDSWIHAMHSLGYMHECVYLNSQFCYPTPQSRDRMYVVFWKKGNKKPNLNYTPLAHCKQCGKDVNAIQHWKNPDKPWGKYKTQYVYKCPVHSTTLQPYYYAAFNCIDWSDPGKRIGDRKKDLSPKSKVRILHGLEKFGKQYINPFIVNDQHRTGDKHRVRSVMDTNFTIPTQPHFKLIMPYLTVNYSPGYEKKITDPLGAITTQDHHGLVTPMPFIIKAEHAEQLNIKSATDSLQTQASRQSFAVVVPMLDQQNRTGQLKPTTDPLTSVLAGGNHHGLLMAPFIVENKGQSLSRAITDPLSTATTVPFHGLITDESWNSFITSYYSGSHGIRHITESMQSLTTMERHALVNYQTPRYEDCYYRMLKPGEVKIGMGFHPHYVVTGTAKEQVKQCGNAVTPPAMEWLIQQCVKTLS